MKTIDTKSVVLGIGIGAIIISVISIIYTAGIGKNISKEEIIARAKEYGMVEKVGSVDNVKDKVGYNDNNIAMTKASKSDTSSIIVPKDSKLAPTLQVTQAVPTVTATPQAEVYISFSINPGDSSGVVAQRLFDVGLIADKAKFLNLIREKGLSTEIAIGNFKIKKGASIEAIIKLITSKA